MDIKIAINRQVDNRRTDTAMPHPADFVLLAVVVDDGLGLVVERL